MKSIALICLDCLDGQVNRYLRVDGNKPEKTGEAFFNPWDPKRSDDGYWATVFRHIQNFRIAYIPPEDPAPHPTSPLRTVMRAAA